MACCRQNSISVGITDLSLEQGGLTTAAKHEVVLAVMLALIDDLLEPGVRRFDLASHVRELVADDGMLAQLGAEGRTLATVLDALLEQDAREAVGLHGDADALVVEVGHDELETLVLVTDEILHGNLDVLESDIRCEISALSPDSGHAQVPEAWTPVQFI